MRLKLTLLIIIASCCIIALPQSKIAAAYKRCSIKTINYEQGLLNNGTTDVITDASGFTWISTKTGMQRYNGYILETINPVVDDEIISINGPVYFFQLKNGLIWISYQQGILEYDCHKNSFKKVITLPGEERLNFSIIPLKENNQGIWCMQNKRGMVLYSVSGGFIKKRLTNEEPLIQNVFNRTEILNNTLFAVNDHSVFIYDGNSNIEQVNFNNLSVQHFTTQNLYSFTCSNSFLYLISNNNLRCISISKTAVQKDISLQKLTNENINRSSCFLFNGNELFITLNTHLYQFDTLCNYNKEFTNFSLNPAGDIGFIRAVYADNFSRIWVLGNDNIKRIQNLDIPFSHFFYANEKNNFIRSMYYDEKRHVLLAGCYNGGLQLFDTSGNALWEHAIISDSIKDVNGIEKLDDNNYFIETYSRGLFILNLPVKKITPFRLSKAAAALDYANINFINNLQRIDDSTILIATSTNVFSCVIKNLQMQSARTLFTFDQNASQQIDCFFYTNDKVLWAGTVGGAIYKKENSKPLQVIYLPEPYQVRTIMQDAEKNMWIGTDKGLYVYTSNGVFIKKIDTDAGLLNDCIYAILPVKGKPAVYASSNLGLSYIALNEKNIINYTKESGLQENEFNTGSAVKTSQGRFYFGGVNGITCFYNSLLSGMQDHPLLNITRLLVNDSSYNFSTQHWRNDSIFLNYNQNHIQIDLGALGLLNTNEYKYQYRLRTVDEAWQTTHQPTGIKYLLQPGKYVFDVRCSPVFSSGSVFSKSFIIIISPAWWQTIWFTALLVLLCVGIIAFIVQQYIRGRYLKRIRKLELQQQIQKERERISMDLHDNLGSYATAIAANVSSILQTRNVTDDSIFNQLKDNSQLIINQLRDTIWALHKEEISLTAVSDRFKVFLQKIQPNYPDVVIDIVEEITSNAVFTPSNALHLFRIMQEAVNNALKHSTCRRIVITIVCAGYWKIVIKDNGTGIPSNAIAGHGLMNMKSRSLEAGFAVSWEQGQDAGTDIIIASNNN